MKKVLPYIILIAGISMSIMSMMALAQDDAPEPSEYAGTRECRDCHRDVSGTHRDTAHALTMVEIEEDMEEDENPIVADFSAGEDLRTVTLPDSDESIAFTQENIAFTLGAGRNKQAFIYGNADDGYFVLPAQWDVASAAWEAVDLGDEWPSEGYAFGQNCAGCHTVGIDVSDYSWEEEGVSCESCHGPGLDHVLAADDAGGSVDDEERALIYGSIHMGYDGATCGQCHVRGLAEDGIHPYPVGFYPGTNELDSLYEPVPPSDETHWWATEHARLPNMQYNEALLSAHPNSLASAQESEGFAAECMTCHSVTQRLVDLRLSNEDIDPATVDPLALAEANPFGVTCASCHNPHGNEMPDEEDADAEAVNMAPLPAMLWQDSYSLCTSCHTDNDITDGLHYPVQQVFEGIALVEGIEVEPSPHFTAEDGPTCSTCHMQAIPTYNGERNSHTFNIVPPGAAADLEGLPDSCSSCHEEGQVALQQLIDDIQAFNLARIEAARAAVTDDTPAWVTDALNVVESEGSAGIHNYTYTDTLLDTVEIELNLFND